MRAAAAGNGNGTVNNNPGAHTLQQDTNNNPHRYMPRQRQARPQLDHSAVAAETVAAVWRRGYHSTVQAEEGRAARVELAPAARLRDAPSMTVAIEDTWRLPSGGRGGGSSGPAGALTLFAGGSFEAALWLLDGAAAEDSAEAARRPLVLDFASDSNPGGGWRGKQQGTQEESLCRQSNLGLCLEDLYRRAGGASYMPRHGAVYAPDVVVFRAGEGEGYKLLAQPRWVSVVASSLRNGDADSPELLRGKVDGVLRVAAAHRHTTLVLGAWGCGAFGNAAEKVAAAFRDALLSQQHCGRFDHVVFALPKRRSEHFAAFQAALPEAAIVQAAVVVEAGAPTGAEASDVAPADWCSAPWMYGAMDAQTESEPVSADWATDELVPLVKKGDTLQEAGDLDSALTLYQEAMGGFRDAGIKRPKLKAKIDAVKALRISAAEEPATPADTRPTSSTGLGLVRTRSAQERARREAAEVAEQAAEAEVAEAEAELIAVRNELGVLRGERRGQRGRPGR
jgi:uncharacterized protein (TIGR02452 family)